MDSILPGLSNQTTYFNADFNKVAVLPSRMGGPWAWVLDSFFLSNNGLALIELEAFRFFPNITYLQLNSNRLTEIEPGVFDFLPKLDKLSLRRNLLSRIPGFKLGVPLQQLVMDENPLIEVTREHFKNFSKILTSFWLDCAESCGATVLAPDLFGDCVNLTQLVINGLPASSIHDNLFESGVKTLTGISLSVRLTFPVL